MRNVEKYQGPLGALAITQNAFTRVLNGTQRSSLGVQNPSASDILLYLDDDPFGITFDGGDHIAIDGVSTDADLIAATEGSVNARIYLDAVGITDRTVVSISDASANEYFRIYVNTAGKVVVELRTAAAVQWTLTLNVALLATKWYDINVRHNGTIPTMLINGEKRAQTLAGATQASWMAALSNLDTARIGSLNTNGAGEADWFVGDIEELRIFAGIEDISAAGRTLVARYNMDTGSGTTASDTSGNSHNGTFGAAAAAPAWAAVIPYRILGAGSGKDWEADAIPQTGLWAYTTGAGVTIVAFEGLETPPRR